MTTKGIITYDALLVCNGMCVISARLVRVLTNICLQNWEVYLRCTDCLPLVIPLARSVLCTIWISIFKSRCIIMHYLVWFCCVVAEQIWFISFEIVCNTFAILQLLFVFGCVCAEVLCHIWMSFFQSRCIIRHYLFRYRRVVAEHIWFISVEIVCNTFVILQFLIVFSCVCADFYGIFGCPCFKVAASLCIIWFNFVALSLGNYVIMAIFMRWYPHFYVIFRLNGYILMRILRNISNLIFQSC